MTLDRTAQDVDLSTIPGEFRENYRFLRELINCEEKNDSLRRGLENSAQRPLCRLRGKLNRRHMRILKDYLGGSSNGDSEDLDPPVPPELEASIRIRTRSTWLPWEAEAIRKIQRWRSDVRYLVEELRGAFAPAAEMPKVARLPRKPG